MPNFCKLCESCHLNSPNRRCITWKNFPEFYASPVIQELAEKDKWAVSTTKKKDPNNTKERAKMPVDVNQAVSEEDPKIVGASFEQESIPTMTLTQLCQEIPCATNNAFLLDCLEDNIVILDIEAKCPQEIKEKFLKLPYLYGETSMSGKGYHLVFRLPKCYINYPDAMAHPALRGENGDYEILLNHWVTFTRNILPPQTEITDIEEFENIFAGLAESVKASVKAKAIKVEDIDTTAIPFYDDIYKVLIHQRVETFDEFRNRPDRQDNPEKGLRFDNSISSYEYKVAGFMYNRLEKILKVAQFKTHKFTDEEKATIVYAVISEKLDYREKHDEMRCNMPYLMYITSTLIAKNKEERRLWKETHKKKINPDDLWLDQ